MTSRMTPERLAHAAFLYYVQNRTQDDVARRLGVSRSNVSRMLRAARDQNIVRFEIAYPVLRDSTTERALLDTFESNRISEIVVARRMFDGSDEDDTADLLAVAKAGVDWLGNNVHQGSSIGLSWGTTIAALVDVARFDRTWDVEVVQLAGETSLEPSHSGHDLVRNLAERMGGRHAYISAPAVAPSAEVAESLLQSPQVARALERARDVDVTIMGVGRFNRGSTRLFLEVANATETELREAESKKVIGQICGRFFDVHGEQVELALNSRIVSVGMDDLRRIGTNVVLATGTEKAGTVKALLSANLVDVLIIDSDLAGAVLRQ